MNHEMAAFAFDPKRLMALAAQKNSSYVDAQPFPHIVLDDLFDPTAVNTVLVEFPDPLKIDWQKFNDETGRKKLTTRDEGQLGEFTRNFIFQLNSSTFITFLEKLTGIQGLIPDPHLFGGGLHQVMRGGFLKIRADFNHYERLNVERRINLLLHLNKNWKDEYGGHLELWKRDMTQCVQKVAPLFNRTVVFSTTDLAYHGHPDPLQCPESDSRKSIAIYYYTAGRPAGEMTESHSTLYQRRAGKTDLLTAKNILKKFIPPIVGDLVRLFKK